MTTQDPNTIIHDTRHWLETIVIGLNLCPFAKGPLISNRIKFQVTDADTEEGLLLALHAELEGMSQNDTVETTLLIHPYILQDFLAYNDFLEAVDDVLLQMKLEGIFQIASFHPQYQFADTAHDDAENYTNRSPYPMLHILREASVSAAVDSHPDVSSIPVQNVRKMRELGVVKLREMTGGNQN
jgi:hypothetical protein